MMTEQEMIDVIKAYQDGATIQYNSKTWPAWRDVRGKPAWTFHVNNYRVKPNPEADYYILLPKNCLDPVVGARVFRTRSHAYGCNQAGHYHVIPVKELKEDD